MCLLLCLNSFLAGIPLTLFLSLDLQFRDGQDLVNRRLLGFGKGTISSWKQEQTVNHQREDVIKTEELIKSGLELDGLLKRVIPRVCYLIWTPFGWIMRDSDKFAMVVI